MTTTTYEAVKKCGNCTAISNWEKTFCSHCGFAMLKPVNPGALNDINK